MLKRKTVFIVGAGASHEFGLPLGWELIREIQKAARAEAGLRDWTESSLSEAYCSSGFPMANINLRTRLESFANGLSGKASIDQYLRNHRSDEALVGLGKTAIAHQIMLHESRSSLVRDPDGDHWLSRLFAKATDDLDAVDFDAAFENVSFITFNYDRCIEYYLFHQFMRTGQMDAESAARIMAKLKIVHVYGDVGRFDWKAVGKDGATISFYQPSNDPSSINSPFPRITYPDRQHFASSVVAGAKRIRTFCEGLNDKDLHMSIWNELANAENIVFLGFSFFDENMSLLQIRHYVAGDAGLYATTFDLPGPEIDAAKNAMRAMIHKLPLYHVETFSGKATAFMRTYLNTLARAR